MDSQLPKTDLGQLQSEVLNKGADAALPCNLSDYWLDLIGRDLEFLPQAIDHDEPDAYSYMSGPLALIAHILMGKAGGNQVTVPMEDLMHHFEDYRIEIAIETVSRRTHMKANAASLATIFANRTVQFQDVNAGQ